MAEGVYKFSVQNTLGYYRDHFGRLVIEPTEARIVRYIYESCLEGATPAEIAEALTEQGIASPMHRNRWLPGTVRSILKNERYMGDALLQKEYTTDTVPFRKKRNHGEKAQYYVENSNPPIISREVFHAAQKLQESRITTTKREHNSILSGILRCPDCGSTFRRQLLRGTVYWMCSDKAAGATNCQSRRVRENAVFDTFCLMADKLASHRQDLLGTLIHQLEMMQNHGSESQEKIRQIDKQIADLSAQNLVVARLHTNGVLNATDFAAQLSVISNKINALRLDRKKALSEDEDDELIFTLKSLDDTLAGYVPGASFNRELFKETIQSITVMDNSKLTFHLIGGLAFTEQIPENVRCRTA